jgi:hypothetical protein
MYLSYLFKRQPFGKLRMKNHGVLRFTEVCTEVTEIVWKVGVDKY